MPARGKFMPTLPSGFWAREKVQLIMEARNGKFIREADEPRVAVMNSSESVRG
jgi:hypothetical protein